MYWMHFWHVQLSDRNHSDSFRPKHSECTSRKDASCSIYSEELMLVFVCLLTSPALTYLAASSEGSSLSPRLLGLQGNTYMHKYRPRHMCSMQIGRCVFGPVDCKRKSASCRKPDEHETKKLRITYLLKHPKMQGEQPRTTRTRALLWK